MTATQPNGTMTGVVASAMANLYNFWIGVKNDAATQEKRAAEQELRRQIYEAKKSRGMRTYFAIDEDGALCLVILGMFTLVNYKGSVLYFIGVPENIRPLPKHITWY